MQLQKIEIRDVATKKLSNMEYKIIEAAREKMIEGNDHLFMRLFLEEEINSWKKRDKYRNAATWLDYRSMWEMALMNGKTQLATFKTVLR